MTGTNDEDVQQQAPVDAAPQGQARDAPPPADETGHIGKNEENPMPSAQEQEEVVKKKYGGILPKKKPLISKDHERAFFDSADWALGKQGAQKPKGPLEALRPKLQPTHHQLRSRRSPYAPSDDEDVPDVPESMGGGADDHDRQGDADMKDDVSVEDRSCPN